jgi:hypothetical protein
MIEAMKALVKENSGHWYGWNRAIRSCWSLASCGGCPKVVFVYDMHRKFMTVKY